jgi:putative membrane protein
MKIITKLVTTTLAVMVTAYLLPGVDIDNAWVAIVVAIVLSVLNVFVKPLLILLTLPITVVTLGLFLLVINAIIILLTSGFVPGFHVYGFWWALLFSLILSLISSALNSLAESDNRKNAS